MSETLTWGERFSTGGLTSVIGIGITFIVLALLIVILAAIAKLNVVIKQKLSAKPTAQESEPTVAVSDDVKNNNDDAVVAAITAALTVMLSSESTAKSLPRAGFIVKKIKRI